MVSIPSNQCKYLSISKSHCPSFACLWWQNNICSRSYSAILVISLSIGSQPLDWLVVPFSPIVTNVTCFSISYACYQRSINEQEKVNKWTVMYRYLHKLFCSQNEVAKHNIIIKSKEMLLLSLHSLPVQQCQKETCQGQAGACHQHLFPGQANNHQETPYCSQPPSSLH